MTYPDNQFDRDIPEGEELSSEDAYARGASATDGDSGPGVQTGPVSGSPSTGGGGDTQRSLDEQRDKYLRLAAEYDNFRKRTQKERMEAGSRAQKARSFATFRMSYPANTSSAPSPVSTTL